MPKITRDQVKVPADVLADVRETYVDNPVIRSMTMSLRS